MAFGKSMNHARLKEIEKKVIAGERLSSAEGEFLFSPEVDFHAVGELANLVRNRKNGNLAYYNINSHLNPTNVCEFRCGLCAYSRDAGDPDAYVMSQDDVVRRGREADAAGCTELHVVGGANPDLPFEWHREAVRSLHDSFPRVHIKAFTAVEIDWFARRSGKSVETVLHELIAVGLGSMPGGGAEIFAENVRAEICPRKADGATWISVHRTAHRLGLRTNATMLFGHRESYGQRIEHLIALRELQDATGGFQAFVPLSFHPENTKFADLRQPTAAENLRTTAVSRLMLDNFDHVKAYWVSLDVGTAQVALAYGADDLDGTVRHELIHHAAGSVAPEALTVERITQLIKEAGREPVERDSLYRRVVREGADWRAEE